MPCSCFCEEGKCLVSYITRTHKKKIINNSDEYRCKVSTNFIKQNSATHEKSLYYS